LGSFARLGRLGMTPPCYWTEADGAELHSVDTEKGVAIVSKQQCCGNEHRRTLVQWIFATKSARADIDYGGGVSAMFFVRTLRPIMISCSLGACAIHPLPENVTGVKTAAIVHRIRCEARDAVADAASKLHSQKKLQILESIGIVYNFALNGSETEGLTASANFVKPLTNGMWSYNPSLGDSLMRQNVRSFTVVDNFQVLLRQMDAKKCEAEPTGPNYQYPIVGTIGVAEMIHTFIKLALHEDLSGEQSSDINITANGPPTMVDSITFTTTLNGSVTPMVMLNPIGMAAQLTSASLGLSLSRTDTHQVLIGLGLPGPVSSLGPPAPISPKQKVARSQQQFGMLISASPRTDGEAAALEAVNHQILRFGVPKSIIVTP
jgi:hypothetical protein